MPGRCSYAKNNWLEVVQEKEKKSVQRLVIETVCACIVPANTAGVPTINVGVPFIRSLYNFSGRELGCESVDELNY